MSHIKQGPATDLRGRPALRDTHQMKFFMKLGCDHRLASAVIGAGGQKIKDMMNRSQTFIKLSKKGNWFPDTQCQLLLIGGPTIQSLLQVLDRVMFELDHTISSLGEHSADVRVIVPQSSVPRIIGPGEGGLNQIRQMGCRIVVDDRCYAIDDGILEQFITLTGPVQSLAQAVTRVNECVQVDFLQPWYVKWGSHWILCYADELMNRVDKSAVTQGGMSGMMGHQPSSMGGMGMGMNKGANPGIAGPHVPPAITQPGNIQPIIDLAQRFHNGGAVTATLSTEMAVEVTLEPAHAEIVSAGPGQIGLRNIERNSGAQLNFAPEENGVCPLTITGLPFSIYCAHLLLMSRIVRHIETGSSPEQHGSTPATQQHTSPQNTHAPSPYAQNPDHVSPAGTQPPPQHYAQAAQQSAAAPPSHTSPHSTQHSTGQHSTPHVGQHSAQHSAGQHSTQNSASVSGGGGSTTNNSYQSPSAVPPSVSQGHVSPPSTQNQVPVNPSASPAQAPAPAPAPVAQEAQQ